jgi:hypothetical protein
VSQVPRLTSKASAAAHVLRSAVPSVLIATVIPLGLFYVGLGLGSVVTAIVLSVVYAYGVAVYQYLRWRRVSGLLLMTLFMVTLRAGTAAASGQPYLYFVVPVAETGGFALLFLVTMLTKEPLIVRLARDFVPALAEDFASRRQLIRWLSLVWALTYLASAGTTLVLLLTQSIPVYMGAHEFAGWGWIGAGIVVSVLLCRWRAHGLYQAAMSLRHSLEASPA